MHIVRVSDVVASAATGVAPSTGGSCRWKQVLEPNPLLHDRLQPDPLHALDENCRPRHPAPTSSPRRSPRSCRPGGAAVRRQIAFMHRLRRARPIQPIMFNVRGS